MSKPNWLKLLKRKLSLKKIGSVARNRHDY